MRKLGQNKLTPESIRELIPVSASDDLGFLMPLLMSAAPIYIPLRGRIILTKPMPDQEPGNIIIISITVLLSFNVHAEGLTGSVDQLSVNQNMPINIEANSLEIFENEKKAIFSGQVRIVQDKISLTADLVYILYRYEEDIKKTSIESIECLDNVLIQIDDQIASGNRAFYDLLTKKITLSENVLLSKGNNAIKGETALVDLDSRIIKIISSKTKKDGKVRAILTPNQSN